MKKEDLTKNYLPIIIKYTSYLFFCSKMGLISSSCAGKVPGIIDLIGYNKGMLIIQGNFRKLKFKNVT